MYAGLQLAAGGDINPSRFVKVSTAADNTALEADANEQIVGISQEGTQDAPIPSAATLAAAAGEQFAIYPAGSVCLLLLGGTVTRADNLKSDADGKGVAAATTGTTEQKIGAIALQSGVSGEKIRVLVCIRERYPALA